MKALTTENDLASGVIAKLTHEKNDLQTKVTETATLLSQEQEKVKSLEAKVAELEARLANSDAVRSQEATIHAEEIAALKNKITELEVNSHEKETTSAKEVEEEIREVGVDSMSTDVDLKLNELKTRHSQETDALKRKITELQTALDEKDITAKESKQQMDEAVRSLKKLEKECTQLQKDLNAAKNVKSNDNSSSEVSPSFEYLSILFFTSHTYCPQRLRTKKSLEKMKVPKGAAYVAHELENYSQFLYNSKTYTLADGIRHNDGTTLLCGGVLKDNHHLLAFLVPPKPSERKGVPLALVRSSDGDFIVHTAGKFLDYEIVLLIS